VAVLSLRYEIERQLGLVLVVGSGVIRDEDLERLNKRLMADPDLRHCTMELDDMRAVTNSVGVSADCLRRLGEKWGERDSFLEGTKLASVAPRDVEFGLTRMYQLYRGGTPVEMRLFREMGEAEHWLDLPAGFVTSRRAVRETEHSTSGTLGEPSGDA